MEMAVHVQSEVLGLGRLEPCRYPFSARDQGPTPTKIQGHQSLRLSISGRRSKYFPLGTNEIFRS